MSEQTSPPPIPTTVEQVDRELEQQRQALGLVSRFGRAVVMEQVDALLDRRNALAKKARKAQKAAVG